jgi:small conductance mechanosensitive channel
MDLDKFYDKVYTWILTVGPRIVMALVVLVIGFWLVRLFKRWFKKAMTRKRLSGSLQPFLTSLAVTTLQVLLLLATMQIIGIQLTILTTLVGAIGVAAGLALSGTMQNFASGVLILLLKPYRIGDNIIAQGQDGIVSSIQLFYTVVITFDNRTVIIPNGKLSNEVIINVSKQGKRRIDMELKFNYGFDFNKVKEVIEKTLHDVPYIDDEPKPRVNISALDPDGYKVMINGWAPPGEYEKSKFDLQKRIIDDLKAAGFKLPGMV